LNAAIELLLLTMSKKPALTSNICPRAVVLPLTLVNQA
jgi:hypothetical protein